MCREPSSVSLSLHARTHSALSSSNSQHLSPKAGFDILAHVPNAAETSLEGIPCQPTTQCPTIPEAPEVSSTSPVNTGLHVRTSDRDLPTLDTVVNTSGSDFRGELIIHDFGSSQCNWFSLKDHTLTGFIDEARC